MKRSSVVVATPHQVRDPMEARELVTRARRYERLMQQRRTLLRRLAGVDAEIRTARKIVHDMMAPFVYAKPLDVNGVIVYSKDNGAPPTPRSKTEEVIARAVEAGRRPPGRPRTVRRP